MFTACCNSPIRTLVSKCGIRIAFCSLGLQTKHVVSCSPMSSALASKLLLQYSRLGSTHPQGQSAFHRGLKTNLESLKLKKACDLSSTSSRGHKVVLSGTCRPALFCVCMVGCHACHNGHAAGVSNMPCMLHCPCIMMSAKAATAPACCVALAQPP